MQLSILDALNKAKQSKIISDFELQDELSRLGADKELIEELLLDPIEKRQYFLDYFRNKK